MVKKHHKKKASAPTPKTTNALFKINNTIMLTIMIVIVLTVSIVALVMFMNSRATIIGIQDNMSKSFMQSLSVFNVPNQTAEQFEAELPFLKSKLNEVIYKNYQIKDIVVTDNDKNLNVVYKTLEESDEFEYKLKGEPSTFKLQKSSRYIADNYRAILVTKHINDNNSKEVKTYHIQLIIPQADNAQMQALYDFTQIFFS